jgi:hypothetical protein
VLIIVAPNSADPIVVAKSVVIFPVGIARIFPSIVVAWAYGVLDPPSTILIAVVALAILPALACRFPTSVFPNPGFPSRAEMDAPELPPTVVVKSV